MQSTLKYLSILLIGITLLTIVITKYLFHQDLESISNFSNLSFPQSSSLLSSNDSGESLQVNIRIERKSEYDSFLVKNKFVLNKSEGVNKAHTCKNKLSIMAQYLESTKAIELLVHYSDPGGDFSCE